MSSHISALSLESYVQLYKALTKGSDKVQNVTPIEECYYKISDIKQGRVLRYLGSSCQPELCEVNCPGNHQHYRCGSFRELLQLTSGQLQDAWMLLASDDDGACVADDGGSHQVNAAASDEEPDSCARSKRARISTR
eukprot:gene10269-10428_t